MWTPPRPLPQRFRLLCYGRAQSSTHLKSPEYLSCVVLSHTTDFSTQLLKSSELVFALSPSRKLINNNHAEFFGLTSARTKYILYSYVLVNFPKRTADGLCRSQHLQPSDICDRRKHRHGEHITSLSPPAAESTTDGPFLKLRIVVPVTYMYAEVSYWNSKNLMLITLSFWPRVFASQKVQWYTWWTCSLLHAPSPCWQSCIRSDDPMRSRTQGAPSCLWLPSSAHTTPPVLPASSCLHKTVQILGHKA